MKISLDNAYWDLQRQIGDPFADTTIERLIADGSFSSAREIMTLLTGNKLFLPESTPPALKEYVLQASILPEWFDPEKIKQAERISTDFGLVGAFVLLCKSLPECYALHRGAQVLHATGRLIAHKTVVAPYIHRIMETLQFASSVMQQGGFTENGRAIEAILKVRLIHAAIRYFTKNSPAEWDVTELGVPINQEDLAFTLTTFSYSVIIGSRMAGIKVSHNQRENFVHMWAVTAYLLGITPENIPMDFEQSGILHRKILARQAGYSPEGEDLTKSLVEFMHYLCPSIITRWFTTHLIHHFVGEKVSNAIGISSGTSRFIESAEKILHKTINIFTTYEQSTPLFGKIMRWFTHNVVKAVLAHYSDRKSQQFQVPESLTG
ncbi:MAG: oxygenase MpaB family protein [Bacteroidota bacterium]